VAPTLDPAQAALAAAAQAGLQAHSAEVVRVSANVVVRLEPGPVAARMPGAIAGFRDPAANLAREARLAAALAGRGAPVPAPLGGPYEGGGRLVTLWPWIEPVAESGDSRGAGRALRACHDALADVDDEALGLEPLAMLHEALGLARRDRSGARDPMVEAVTCALDALAAAPRSPVHGDSHAGNVLWTAGGPLWSDWEDAHLAPVEWDLACLVAPGRLRGDDFGWAEEALAAHGGAYDPELLDVCVYARAAQGAACLSHLLPGRPEVRVSLDARLAWLREHPT
jgi:aminoglycoside phosphotransferase (APT) family kinase protein